MVSAKCVVSGLVRLALLALFGYWAWSIRLHAIEVYGRVIHEFDPWFNFRATQYLADNGWQKFFTWFDYEAWYPLGRPVGTTIYPGMQIASVAIWKALNWAGWEMSLNDVCVFVPTWFAVSATLFLALIAYECSGSANVLVAAAAIMCIIPAHLMRSIGGGFDNESVAMTAMCMTFFFWVRSMRNERSAIVFGAATGFAYIFMVATWGGYVFVLNMIGVHAAGLIILGRYSRKLWIAYTLFMVIGTLGAIQVPVVGLAPLKSLEQLGPMAVLFGMQIMAACDFYSTSRKHDKVQRRQVIVTAFGAAAAVGVVIVAILFPTGYFGPLSSRVRGLFVQHTRTGNPLVDSVAEHQPASRDAYYQNLHFIYYAAPVGFIISLFRRTDANLFLIFYAIAAYYFSSKMARLIILLGPIASALGGLALWSSIEWAGRQLAMIPKVFGLSREAAEAEAAEEAEADGDKAAATPKKRGAKKGKKKSSAPEPREDSLGGLVARIRSLYNSKAAKLPRVLGACALLVGIVYGYVMFYQYSHYMAKAISQPMVMFQARLNNGEVVMVDDYREAYWWLRDNTPEDSRVMAWWDYGYQINGIANRTSIADGNTWNHEHIATLARCLTSPVKQAHRMIRHLADYVLVWAGGGGDDLAKSPHMARIGTSVYKEICGSKDPMCTKFGFVDRRGTPTPMMRKSLLYNLHSHNIVPGVHVDENRFREVYSSKYGKVRIFQVMSVSQKSKKWVADPKNRKCDHPGSWYCVGQYPPALNKMFKTKKAFKQLEDFNA